MLPNHHERAVQLSILDRLIDEEPDNRSEVPITREKSLTMFRRSVKRDLEWLLNTTRIADPTPEPLVELQDSMWIYGFPDLTSITLQNNSDEQRLLRNLETAIQKFEPRLTRVRVSTTDKITKSAQSIQFHIDAMLMIDPMPERIAFDTVLDIGKSSYRVKD